MAWRGSECADAATRQRSRDQGWRANCRYHTMGVATASSKQRTTGDTFKRHDCMLGLEYVLENVGYTCIYQFNNILRNNKLMSGALAVKPTNFLLLQNVSSIKF